MSRLETGGRLHYIRRAGAGGRRDVTEESELKQNIPAAQAATPTSAFAPLPGADGGALHAAILASLEDDKAEDILSIPLAGKSEMADHMVIATGRSSRQVSAIAEKLVDRLKVLGLTARLEGKELGDWVLIDAGDVVVHVFRPEVRDFYQLEKMWMTLAPARPRAADTA